jgi:T-complex protein 1 subunit beta
LSRTIGSLPFSLQNINSANAEAFRSDLINIARTTLSSKVLSQDKEYFAKLAVDAVLRLKGSTNLEHIQIIKKTGGRLIDSYLDEGACPLFSRLKYL